jgi:hypothetical protein
MAFLVTVRQLIEARCLAGWITSGTTLRTPVALESAEKTTGLLIKSDGSATIPGAPTTAAWIRCTLRVGDGQQRDLNATPRVSQSARIYLDCFAPLESGGRAVVDPLVDLLIPIFDRKQFTPVFCEASTVSERGQDGDWWWAQVITRCRLDRFST